MPSHISNAYRTNILDDRTCQVFLRGSVFIRWCLLVLMLWTAQRSHKIPWALYSHDFLHYLYHTRHHRASIPSFLSGANLLSTILSPDSNGSSIYGIFEILYHEIDNFSTHTTPGDPPSVSAPSDDRKGEKPYIGATSILPLHHCHQINCLDYVSQSPKDSGHTNDFNRPFMWAINSSCVLFDT